MSNSGSIASNLAMSGSPGMGVAGPAVPGAGGCCGGVGVASPVATGVGGCCGIDRVGPAAPGTGGCCGGIGSDVGVATVKGVRHLEQNLAPSRFLVPHLGH
jgi:hypothetical protein